MEIGIIMEMLVLHLQNMGLEAITSNGFSCESHVKPWYTMTLRNTSQVVNPLL
jgi:hypothetical protein